MNSQTTKDITGFRSYLPDALHLKFEEQLSVRAIARQLGLSHSTIHNLFQRFNASGITWPLPESLSFAHLDAILYANRKKVLPDPQISESTWRKSRRTSYSREFKIRLIKQTLQPSAVVARIAREHNINDNLTYCYYMTSLHDRSGNIKVVWRSRKATGVGVPMTSSSIVMMVKNFVLRSPWTVAIVKPSTGPQVRAVMTKRRCRMSC